MMANRWQKLRWTIPLILLLTTIIDSALPAIFPTAFLAKNQIVVSHITLYFVVVFAFYFRDSWILPYSFIFGLFYDSYNTTILGLNAILYLIITIAVINFKRYLPKNTVINLMIFVVAITFLDSLVYIFYNRIGVTDISLLTYLTTRLAPTLIFNIVAALLLHFPKNAILNWLGWEDYIIF